MFTTPVTYFSSSSSQIPLQIPGLKLWLDADDTSTITETANAVSQWDDKSGNANHVSQATGANQPLTNTVTINGKNAIKFDGVNDFLSGSVILTPSNEHHIFVVFQYDNINGTLQSPYYNGDGNFSGYGLMSNGDDNNTILYGVVNFKVDGSASSSVQIQSMSYDSSPLTAKLYINGQDTTITNATSGSPVTPSGASLVGTYRLAAPVTLQGKVAEIIFYDRPLSTNERQKIETYLSEKWFSIPEQMQGLQVWYDAADTSTITETANAVSQWDDKSGNANHATEATGSKQPLTNTRKLNGNNVLLFDGTDDRLSYDQSFLSNTSYTIFAVEQRFEVVSTLRPVISGSGTGDNQFNIVYINGGDYLRFSHGSQSQVNVDPIEIDSDTRVLSYTHDVTQGNFAYVNGVLAASNTGSTPDLTSPTTTGQIGQRATTQNWDGNIAEYIAYDRVLSPNERKKVENYLLNKWFTVPTTIPDLGLWLDASNISSITETANAVSQIDDLSGNGFNAVQGTGANQPLTNTATINGLNTIRFDGTDDFMSISSFSANLEQTIFIVGEWDGFRYFFVEHSANASSNDGMWFYGNGTSGARARRGGVAVDTPTESGWAGTDADVFFMRMDGSTLGYNKGKNTIKSAFSANISGLTNSIVTDTLYLGRSGGAIPQIWGNLGEMLIYDRALSDAESQYVIDYLKNKWGI